MAPKRLRWSVVNCVSSSTKPPVAQPFDQMDQAHLRGVGLAREHALAEEGRAQRHAVEPADQPAFAPGLDGMGVADPVQVAYRLRGSAPLIQVDGRSCALFGAAVDRRLRSRCRSGSSKRPWRITLRQAVRNMEAVERNDAARLGPDPEDFRVVGAFGHRKDARRIGLQQKVRGYAVAGRIGTGHRDPAVYSPLARYFSSQWMS